MKYVLVLTVVALLAGCGASPIVPLAPESLASVEEKTFPELDTVHSKKVGEVVTSQGKLELRDSLTITTQTQFNKKEGESSFWTCALTVEPQTVFLRGHYKKEETIADCYGAVNAKRTLADGTTNFNCPGAPLIATDVCKEPNGNIFMAFLTHKASLEQDFQNLVFDKKAAEGSKSFVQEIVYGGVDDGKAKFIYKEYSTSLNKPDFFQEFKSDAAEGSIAVFRNLKIKIVTADESSLRYSVISRF